MRQSELFAKIKKEAPKEAETISHKFLARADFIDQLASGIYSFLPLGFQVQKKIEAIIRQELLKIGAWEFSMPALQPKNLWEKTGRWQTIDPPLFKLKDRHQKELALGSTHEEVITHIVSKRIKSLADLPLALFQIQTKFRNEIRSTGGLLRTREFLMQDLYSFHTNQKDFEEYYGLMKKVYQRIFKRCGLKTIITEASGIGFTKEYTHEFQTITPAGEDAIIFCPTGHFSQNKEIARVKKGDQCPRCSRFLESAKSVEVANIFPLGVKYAQDLGAYFTDKDGERKPIIMGCYGIGLGRLLATVVEIHHDGKGIIWPKEIAPFQIHLMPIENNQKVKAVAQKLYQDLQKQGIEILYDDREDKTAGEKFAEADLIGIPIRLVVSEKTLAKKSVEIKKRSEQRVKLCSIKSFPSCLKM